MSGPPSRRVVALDAQSPARLVQSEITPALREFNQRRPFFIIATSCDQGDCDASLRGRDTAASGRPCPLLIVKRPRTLLFADVRVFGIYNSTGEFG